MAGFFQQPNASQILGQQFQQVQQQGGIPPAQLAQTVSKQMLQPQPGQQQLTLMEFLKFLTGK